MKHYFNSVLYMYRKKNCLMWRMRMLADYVDLHHQILSDAPNFSMSYTYIIYIHVYMYMYNLLILMKLSLISHLIWINDIIVPCCKCLGQRDISCKYDNSNHQCIWNHASHQQKRWSRWYSQPTLEKSEKKVMYLVQFNCQNMSSATVSGSNLFLRQYPES